MGERVNNGALRAHYVKNTSKPFQKGGVRGSRRKATSPLGTKRRI